MKTTSPTSSTSATSATHLAPWTLADIVEELHQLHQTRSLCALCIVTGVSVAEAVHCLLLIEDAEKRLQALATHLRASASASAQHIH